MSYKSSPSFSKSTSPLASTEERSIHDNIDINKSNLEKGLRNRPNQYVLVDRGILLNPGKAYSDKMHQLDLAKKRDTIRKKIENRPTREELVGKLILLEESDGRKKEINRIRQVLDSSISTRPGSLELVDKNILQVDRLLASKVHNGDISYPKVCLENQMLDSNLMAPLPMISEVDLQNSLNDLTDILSQSSSSVKSSFNNNKGAQISCKKTCRVGRFSFHNIEFRPSAQKAREYQQNELLEYEKIQAQHNPSLIKVHSELALKSRTRCRSSKFSLLHRLNVHELKSECKLRFIACSNIPKVQLVEKLLPYEAEILEAHTSFEQNRSQKIDRRPEFSPPDFSTTPSALIPPPPPHPPPTSYPVITKAQSFLNGSHLSRICHSLSEPIIPDYSDHSNSMSPIHLNLIENSPIKFYHNIQNFQQFNSNNSFPLINGHSASSHQSYGSLHPPNGYSHHQNKLDNVFFQSQPDVWNSNNFNGFKMKTELEQSMPSGDQYFTPVFSVDNSSSIVSDPLNDGWSNQFLMSIPLEVNIPSVPPNCTEKFELISKQIALFKNTVDKIYYKKRHNSSHIMMQWAFNEYKCVRDNLIQVCNEMVDFINMELKYKRIDDQTATYQKTWLNDLLNLVNSDFNLSKIDNAHFYDQDLLSSTDLSVSFDGDCEVMLNRNDDLDGLDIIDFLDNETNKGEMHSIDNETFLKNEARECLWSNGGCGITDLRTPETDAPCASPMSACDHDDLGRIMDSLLDSTDLPYI